MRIPLEVKISDDHNIVPLTTVIDMTKPTALSSDLAAGDFIADRFGNGIGLKGFYPERALATNANGDATVKCKADAAGALSGCAISAELPSGQVVRRRGHEDHRPHWPSSPAPTSPPRPMASCCCRIVSR